MSNADLSQVERISLAEFEKRSGPDGFQDVLSRINGGSFMECHKLIAAETGIWIDDLVPVFQKLDAALVARSLPRELS
jgi:hypothetical protein